MTTNWMRSLARHYEATRKRFPDQNLLILFDIDGTILDNRSLVLHVLRDFDRVHGTSFFRRLQLADINVHENCVAELLESLGLLPKHRERVLAWYEEQRWKARAVLESHRPYHGVLEVIRWFQLQERTFVGLNSGRLESLRAPTLRTLNELGREYRVEFSSPLLHLRPDSDSDVAQAKLAGIRHFQAAGYVVFAYVDNEPRNLTAAAAANADGGMLLLHANTIFESKRARVPRGTARGHAYDLTELIDERDLPRHIHFVWGAVNHEENLRQFLGSNVHWAEVDVRVDPATGALILRDDSFEDRPLHRDEALLRLDDVIALLQDRGTAIKLDLKDGPDCIDPVLELLHEHGLEDFRIWFSGRLERLGEDGFRRLRSRHPGAIIECPVDFLAPLIRSAPDQARAVLDMLRTWGISRFSIRWGTPETRPVFDRMDQWGLEVTIRDVPNLEAFLQATLLLPRSITSDFNFPKWQYFGLGPGLNLHTERVGASD